MEYTLPDLIDLERLRTFFDDFHQALGIHTSITDLKGNVFAESQMYPICGEFHRRDERCMRQCLQSDSVLAVENLKGKKSCLYPCLNGLNHAISAIVIDGHYIANIFCGQFLLAPPDMAFFRSQAVRYGFDETQYLGALMQTPIIDEKRLPQILSFLASAATMLGEMGLERLRLLETERSLKETQNLYGIITEYTNDAVWSMDMNLCTTWVTPSVLRNRGYSLAELAAMTIEEHLAPESLGRAMEVIAAEMTPENLADPNRDLFIRGEFEYTCKDGSTIWADTVVRLRRDGAGNPIGFLCSSHDITGWKRTEAALQEAQQRFQMITEHMHDAVWIMDMNLRTTWVTPSVIRNRGYSFEELVAMPLEEHLTPESLKRVSDLIVTHLTPENLADKDREIIVTCELEYRQRGGGTLWGDTTVKLIRDKEGNPSEFLCTEHDITEWKRTETALRESEEKYRLIAENVSDVIWTTDMDLNFTYISPSIARVRGYSVQEAMTQKLGDRLTPSSMQSALATIAAQTERRQQDSFQQTGKLTIELEQYRKDGSTVWTENEINYLLGKEREPIGIIGVTRDISQRKKTEQALRESEERFRSIIQSSSDLIMILDEQGTATYESPSTARILGYPPGYFIGRSTMAMVHPDDLAYVTNELEAVVSSANDGLPSEFRFRKADGTWLHLESLGSNQLHNPGIRGILITARDITERKSALEALRAGEERFRLITENTKEIIWMMDMNLRFTYINPYIGHNMGYTPEEYLTKSLPEVMTPASVDRCMNLFVEELENERRGDMPLLRSRTIEVEHIHQNGRIIWAEIKMTFLRDGSGKAIGILGFTRDISERKQIETERQNMEERLRRSEKMEALGTLAGGVAHDLNNVLGVIVGYSELLLMEIPEGTPLRGCVTDILQSSERAAAIIQDLLTLARRNVAVAKVVSLNDIVSACLSSPEFDRIKGYHPRVNFRHSLGKDLLHVKGSPVHLSKTIMNLISNAAEAIGGEGEVTIATENRYLDTPIRGYDEMRSGEYAIVRVSDTGRGIAAADMGKIFEPFYTKKVMGRHSGTGLGLAVVWGTVKDHEGYIDVESSEGTGSTFTIYLPASREALAVEDQSAAPETYRSRGESILVVDDIREQRELAMHMLSRLGYRVTTVSGGEEAAEYLRENRVDLLILDMIMEPGIDGLETYRRVLQYHPLQKAILVSGFSETERVRETQKLGAGAYIRKPYLLEKIGLAVRNELDRPSSRSSETEDA